MSGRGNPPQGAPGAMIPVMVQQPFVDSGGVLTAWAAQFLTRLIGGVTGTGGVIDQITQIISGGSTSITIGDVSQALNAALGLQPFPPELAAFEGRLQALDHLILALAHLTADSGRVATAEALAALALSTALRPRALDTQDLNATATGTNQGTSYQIKALQTVFTTVAASTGGELPLAKIGERGDVWNAGANNLALYPNGSGTINGGAPSAALIIPVGSWGQWLQQSATAVLVR